MYVRNPVFTIDNRIDCECKHPLFGWVAFTADPNDVEAYGREVYAAALAMGPAAYVTPPVAAPTKAQQEISRQSAYQKEADPLFFQWQAGESTQEEWLAKREEIRLRYPYPTEE